MKNGRFTQWFSVQYARYDRFMEKQGFYIVLAICVMVIVASAVYTAILRDTLENPVLTQDSQAGSAVSQSEDQSLAQALIASRTALVSAPTPTPAPLRLGYPLEGAILRGFSMDQPCYFEAAQAYAVHTGLDIRAKYGEIVRACADGTVERVESSADMGLCVTISHMEGLETRYCGLSEAPYVLKGDRVRQGQTIGHAGSGLAIEEKDGAHLHLELRRNGTLIDPQRMLE